MTESVQLKNTYSAREVAALTGLSARQLQWWDDKRLFASAVSPKRTAAGGFTERRYTPVDLLELLVLADLRRQGLSVARIRLLLETLRTRFGVRLFDAIGGGRLADAADRRSGDLRPHGRRRVLQPAARSASAVAGGGKRSAAEGTDREDEPASGKRRGPREDSSQEAIAKPEP